MKSFKIPMFVTSFFGLCLFSGLDTPAAYADFTFGEPVNLKSVIPVLDVANYDEGINCFSYNGLEIYVASLRPGGYGDYDLWVLRRASIDDDWGPLENLGPAVNSAKEEASASISADGLTLYFSSNRIGAVVDVDYDIYMTTRTTMNAPWGPAVNLGPTINQSAKGGAAACDAEPWISPDGLELYFESYRPGGYGFSDIYVARRPTATDPWGEPVNLGPIVNSPYYEQYLSLSPDGLVLFFGETKWTPWRPGGYGGSDIWMTKRASLSDSWQPPVNLGPKVNGPDRENLPRISPDGRMLYFISNQGGNWNAYQAPILPVVDFNGDGKVDREDMHIMVDHLGENYPLCDIGPFAWGDGIVDVQDMIVLNQYLDYSLVAHWKLDETQCSIAADSAGYHDASVFGAVWQPNGGKIDGAFQFNGISDFVRTPFVLNPADGAFSVFAWIKGGAPGQVVLSQIGGANWLCADPSQGKLMTELQGAGQAAALLSQTVITDGSWHRVGLVWDGSNRILYVDDVEVAKDTQDGLAGSDGGFYFGAGKNLEAGSFWSGLIDDVRIYNRAVPP